MLFSVLILIAPYNVAYSQITHSFKQYHLQVDQGRLSYFKIGHGKKVILFLHGLFGNKKQWIPLVKNIVQHESGFLQE